MKLDCQFMNVGKVHRARRYGGTLRGWLKLAPQLWLLPEGTYCVQEYIKDDWSTLRYRRAPRPR
jgi:hypothetical protein